MHKAPVGEADDCLILDDFVEPARAVLDEGAFAYISGGAGDEIGLAANREAFERRRLRPRVLKGIEVVDLATTLLGRSVTMPIGLAPTGFNRLGDPEGELAVARAAASAGVVGILSTFSSQPLEDVAAVADRPWFQLYVAKDLGVSMDLVARAEASGYTALVITVDLPVVGQRDREFRHHFELPAEMFANFNAPETAGGLADAVIAEARQSISWDDINFIRNGTSLPIILKGILTAEDARIANEQAVEGIVVSNHGGRQLDRAVASLDALEEVVDAAGDACEIYLDGGVRRGVDVVTALALGARAVFIGRPYLYALAAGGEAGVRRCLEILRAETANAMHLMGAATPADLERASVV